MARLVNFGVRCFLRSPATSFSTWWNVRDLSFVAQVLKLPRPRRIVRPKYGASYAAMQWRHISKTPLPETDTIEKIRCTTFICWPCPSVDLSSTTYISREARLPFSANSTQLVSNAFRFPLSLSSAQKFRLPFVQRYRLPLDNSVTSQTRGKACIYLTQP